jgi:hypothetical protein
VGCDDYAIEYAITESRLEMTKKIPVKIALVCPSGEPYVNSSPVSLVRYSHGGQFIAVVTGRLVQIFHLFNLDFSTDKTGKWVWCVWGCMCMGVYGCVWVCMCMGVYGYSG